MIHIKSLIFQKSQKLNLSQNINKNTICQIANTIIQKNTPNVEVFFYQKNSLYLRCSNQIIANEIYLNQEKIKNKINKILKKDIVKKLIIKII